MANQNYSGKAWERSNKSPSSPNKAVERASQTSSSSGTQKKVSVQPKPSSQPKNIPGEFHNPYNFIPAPPRPNHADLGDKEPIGHDRYREGYWSGKITCTLTTITPLLIPDAAKLEENEKGHKTYPLRCVNNQLYLPPTSIKGMLRNAYEAVTNSRLGVFEKHDERLAYRMNAENVDVVPARVERRDGNLVLRVMEDTSIMGYAGTLPRYPRTVPQTPDNFALRYDKTNELPQHGDSVWVRLNPQGDDRIKKSRVTRIRKRKENSSSPGDGNWRRGWVCITNENINGKKYERVFLESDDDVTIPVTPELEALWCELIKNYRETHKKNLQKREREGKKYDEYLGDKPGQTAFSRHIYAAGAENLKEGTLCYIEFDENDEIQALLPVILSRRLYDAPPIKLLDSSLCPAVNLKQLSPADRVFGWVNQQGSGAYKGQLRINSVQYEKCLDKEPLSPVFSEGLPLTILGQPKPQQARFYIAQNERGEPLDRNANKPTSYQESQRIRGRKVYPHHRGTGERRDWRNPMEDRTQQEGSHQEYRRPKLRGQEQRDDQNRSIKQWVNPGVVFSFEVEVINFSPVELGALLWLLDLPKYCGDRNSYHRLGGGKPLGFGSVRIQVQKTDLRQGEDWRKFYSSLMEQTKPEQNEAVNSVERFKEAVKTAYKNDNFESVTFIAAFLKAVKGFDDGKPIHYPRRNKEPDPKGENFKWFTANESTDGFKLSLPFLVEDEGLPYTPKRPN